MLQFCKFAHMHYPSLEDLSPELKVLFAPSVGGSFAVPQSSYIAFREAFSW